MKQTIYDLTPEQTRVFNKLKKAFDDCEKANIYFTNNYGFLQAYDKTLVRGISDRESDLEFPIEDTGGARGIIIANEWSDDKHFLGLTKKGRKLVENDN